jgi:hypothetical protein
MTMQQTSTIPAGVGQTRVILYHNQATSARLRFLRFPYDSVCAFEAMPKLAMLMDDDDEHSVLLHPAKVLQQTTQQLAIAAEALEIEAEYQACVDVAAGPINVFLARFTSIDPPFALAEQLGATFIDLTQARDLAPVELQLLRRAYELIMGG